MDILRFLCYMDIWIPEKYRKMLNGYFGPREIKVNASKKRRMLNGSFEIFMLLDNCIPK